MAVLRRCEFFACAQNPPTLYECKSLGAALLRQAGPPMDAVQRLAGHRSAQMTKKYAEGHEAPFDLVGLGPAGGPSVTEALPAK